MSTIHANHSSTGVESRSFTAKPGKSAEMNLSVKADILKVRFSSNGASESVLFQFGDQQKCFVHTVDRFWSLALDQASTADDGLTIIMIEHPAGAESAGLVQQVQSWIDSTTPTGLTGLGQVSSILIPLQGVHVIWQPHRTVVITDQPRMESVCRSLIEATFYEQELKKIEQCNDQGWAQTQADAPLAFEFNERNMSQKALLESRFQSVLGIRIELARLTPQILVPHVFPPTIASQIGERLRDRTRMTERLELADEKLSAQERVYDHCVQRAGDYLIARKGHILEWVIIILLFMQTILWIVDFLSSMGT